MKAYGSRMNAFHPAVSAVYFLCVISVSMFSKNPVITASGLLGSVLLFPFLCDAETVAKTFGGLAVSAAVITVVNPFISHNGLTALFRIFNVTVSLEALLYGVNFAVIFSSVIIWGMCMNAVMQSEKTTYLIGSVAPKTAMVLSMSLRFIPLFAEKARRISRARKALGLAEGEGRSKLGYASKNFSALIGWSLENSVETANSMKARGYGSSKRGTFFKYSFTVADGLMLAAAIVFTALNVAGQALGGGFDFYPQIAKIPAAPTDIASYAAFFVLAVMPAAIETVWRIRWKYYESKI